MAGMTDTPERCPATKDVPVTDSSGNIPTTRTGEPMVALARCSFERGHTGEHKGAPKGGEPVTWAD